MTLLYPLFLIPAALSLVAFLWLRSAGGGDDWMRVVARPVLDYLRPRFAASRLNFTLLALAIIFGALVSPSLRADNASAFALDEGIVVVADVSKSMALEDIKPRRINAARAAALQISAAAGARPSALIAFAGDAYLLEPFAVDRRQFDAFAAALDIGLVPQEGSNLDRALSLASSVVDQSEVGRARLVIISDGGGFTPQAVFIARRFATQGHRLDIVLTADPATTTPVSADVTTIQDVADAGGGVLLGAGSTGVVDIAPLNLSGGLFDGGQTVQMTLRSTDWRNLSHFLLLLALPALLLAFRQVRS